MNFNTKLPWEDGYVESPTSGRNSPIITSSSWKNPWRKIQQQLRNPNMKKVMIVVAALFVVFALIWSIWFFFFRTVEKSATVGQMRWERQIEIAYVTVTGHVRGVSVIQETA